MDLTTLRLEVRERLGELNADFFTDAEVDRAINDAYRRFSSEERWPWLYIEWDTTLLSGVDYLDLPNDVSFNRVFNLSWPLQVLGGPKSLSASSRQRDSVS